MPSVMRGTAWVFEGLLDVDWEICSFEEFLALREKGQPVDYQGLGKLCMANVDPTFSQTVKPGDFIVAGENMGYGHDHDHACISIRGAGVAAVVCESTNAYFLRNCLEHGLPVVEIPGILQVVKQGDQFELDLERGVLRVWPQGIELRFSPYPDFLMRILDAGGLYPLLAGLSNNQRVR